MKATNPNRLYQKRTLRPMGLCSGSIKKEYIDVKSIGTRIIYPGMVATYTAEGKITVSATHSQPCGLFMNFINGTLDELGDSTEVGIFTEGTCEILAGPNDRETPLSPLVNWPAQSKGDYIYANAWGRLTAGEYPTPIGVLIDHPVDNSKIYINVLGDIKDVYELGYTGIQDPQLINNPDYIMGCADRLGDRYLQEEIEWQSWTQQ